ncbi:MAG TPA: hypothetical protein VGA37_05375 [Gemmatimonadales bacterium]
MVIIRQSRARREAAAGERSARVERALVGTRPVVAFRGHAQDTVTSAETDRRLLLYVTRRDCRPCRRLSALLAETLRAKPGRDAELWVAGAAEREELEMLLTTGTPARDVHALDAEEFRRAFRIEGLPYLAAVDTGGIVRHVHIGYWEGMTLPWVDTFAPRASR